MAELIKNIKASVVDNIDTKIPFINDIKFGIAEVYINYIKLGNFEGFLFDHKHLINVQRVQTPKNNGLIVNNNKSFIELEISY